MVEPDSTHTSPDGRIVIQYASEEMRMSLWVDNPRVIEAATGRTIFKPHSSLVSGEHEWGEDGQFSLLMREYPDGTFWVRLHFDIDAGTVRVDGEEDAHPIASAQRLAAARFRRHKMSNALATPKAIFMPDAGSPPPLYHLWGTFWGRVNLAFIAVLIAVMIGMYMDWLPLDMWVSRWLDSLEH
ncbi:hypothetical protein INR77_02050 [Erythrobacter sp. SCSIO 43205]|uniref:DUF3619 family protein n=1 Tax=Erythrobacter sp. SCSIO 43205 TaxID=2779361 RepID=UPI001CA9EB86|nr:DUF3619 family protein [Erythrobacter sp. SCSIO 43205]UAB78542.1 hypothetical protein INR77_02050 [Erythrobacter sp. SCSIO 43205]